MKTTDLVSICKEIVDLHEFLEVQSDEIDMWRKRFLKDKNFQAGKLAETYFLSLPVPEFIKSSPEKNLEMCIQESAKLD